jgi:hypothetical protein
LELEAAVQGIRQEIIEETEGTNRERERRWREIDDYRKYWGFWMSMKTAEGSPMREDFVAHVTRTGDSGRAQGSSSGSLQVPCPCGRNRTPPLHAVSSGSGSFAPGALQKVLRIFRISR